jgi:hypothetical protein
MLSQHKIDSLTRSVSSVTLDGRRLTADVSIQFQRPMSRGDAETLGGEVANIVDEILGAQIIQGQTPFTATDLEAMTTARIKGTKIAKFRVVSLRLAVPAAHAASVRPGVSKPPERGAGSGPPPSGMRLGAGSTPYMPPGTPSPPPASMPTGWPRSPSPPPVRAPSPVPPARAPSPVPPARASSPVPSRAPDPPPARTSSPAPSVRAPVASKTPNVTGMSTETPSAPPFVTPNRPSQRSIGSSPPVDLDAFAEALAQPLRDAAARVVLSVLSVATTSPIDRLSLLQGKHPARELGREACACYVASIYRGAVAQGESHKTAAAKVEAACRHAFTNDAPSAGDIGFYISTTSPALELAGRLAALLGCDGDTSSFRAAVASCHSGFEERLVLLQTNRG